MFPLANLVATSQVKLGDYVRIDMDDDGNMAFVKEAEGALVPVLLEKYGQDPGFPLAAKAARPARSSSQAKTLQPWATGNRSMAPMAMSWRSV